MSAARGYLRGALPRKMSLNWFMPALVNISVGSPLTTIGAEGTISCPLLRKKVQKGLANFIRFHIYCFIRFLRLFLSGCKITQFNLNLRVPAEFFQAWQKKNTDSIRRPLPTKLSRLRSGCVPTACCAKILIGFILISVANVLFSYFFYTPKMYRINRANRELVMKYRIMQDRLKASERKIAEIRHRDQSVYRALFSTDTLSLDGIYTEYPSEKYRPMADDSYSSLMIGTWKQMDALARQLYLESVSFDQLQILAKNKEKLSSAIPATWPIDRNKLRNGIGAFGMRRHPIYGRYIMHKGDRPGVQRGRRRLRHGRRRGRKKST